MSQSFDHDKTGYARWVKAHREDGFIVIIDIRPHGSPPKLHRAKYKCVTAPDRIKSLIHNYRQDCSTDRRELEMKYASTLMYCLWCFPEGHDA